jgi:hypothetical protein
MNEAFNEPQKISNNPSSEEKFKKPCGGKRRDAILSSDPRIRGQEWHPSEILRSPDRKNELDADLGSSRPRTEVTWSAWERKRP